MTKSDLLPPGSCTPDVQQIRERLSTFEPHVKPISSISTSAKLGLNLDAIFENCIKEAIGHGLQPIGDLRKSLMKRVAEVFGKRKSRPPMQQYEVILVVVGDKASGKSALALNYLRNGRNTSPLPNS